MKYLFYTLMVIVLIIGIVFGINHEPIYTEYEILEANYTIGGRYHDRENIKISYRTADGYRYYDFDPGYSSAFKFGDENKIVLGDEGKFFEFVDTIMLTREFYNEIIGMSPSKRG